MRMWRNGRRYRLKICCPFGRAGSSPAIRTTFFLGVRNRDVPAQISVPLHSLTSIAWRLPAVTQGLCDMDTANVARPGKIGNRSGNPQDARIAPRG